jgi:hypothetical protein
MSHDKRPAEHEADEGVEAQVLKESLGASLAAAAIFAGSSQAGSCPVPRPPGAEDAAAELALIPERDQMARQVRPAPKAKAVTAKRAAKAKKAKRVGRGGRAQPT